jgi:hypothetical protein
MPFIPAPIKPKFCYTPLIAVDNLYQMWFDVLLKAICLFVR